MIITAEQNYSGLDRWLLGKKKVLLVGGDSIRLHTAFCRKLNELGTPIVQFSGFQPNPLYEQVIEGVRMFRQAQCDSILAVGGGSAIDTAKCIRLFASMDGDGADGSFLRQTIVPQHIPFFAMPTTAGSGSEVTRYAVIYYQGEKVSVTDDSCIPDTVLMDPSALKTLPLYQRKATMMDAFCHAVESFWSVHSTEESKAYSRAAIRGILAHADGYLHNTDAGNAGMLEAAQTAGMAIHIAQTTAGHAMCYRLTGIFHAAHGHAAILCVRVLYPWMLRHTDRCTDPRGETYLREILHEIGQAMGCADAESGPAKVNALFDSLALEIPAADDAQLAELVQSVHPERLRNHPIAMDADSIRLLYREALRLK